MRHRLPLLAGVSYAVHLAVVHAMPGLARHQPLDPVAILAGGLTIGLAHAAPGYALASHPVALAVVRALQLAGFWGLCAYLYASHVPLEAGLLAANVEWPLTAGAFDVLLAGVSRQTLAAAMALIVLVAWRDARANVSASSRGWVAAVMAGAWIAAVVASGQTYDETARFVRSGLDQWRGVSALCPAIPEAPAVADRAATGAPRLARSPDVVLVMIESLHAAFLDRRGATGQPILPVLDGLAARGLTVERFYAHSVQTAKGHFSLLTSIAPAVVGVEFERYPDLPVTTLAAELKRAGYRTLFVQGQTDAAFDNTRRFLESHGVDRHLVADDLVTADERDRLGGPWGLSDEGTYLAAERALAEASRSGPVLLMIATVESHQPFSAAPAVDAPFPDARSLPQRYANALHAADAALGRFLARLDHRGQPRDTIVAVTGDHAFPLGTHGLEHNEAGAYEEFFRVPFVLFDPTRPPRHVTGPYGQIDVAPTILHYLGGEVPTAFQGLAIDDDRPASRAGVPLVQPYAGTFIGAVGERFKYLRHIRSGRERLVDLGNDADEGVDLLAAGGASAQVRDRLRHIADWLIANHCALERGRVLAAF